MPAVPLVASVCSHYRDLTIDTRNQRKEKLKNDRLQIRRELILAKLFEPPSNLAVAPGSDGKQVWVDGHFLRRFFSCQDGLEDVFRNATLPSFLKSDLFVCEHQKLAPRTARKGKLLHGEGILRSMFLKA